MLRNSVNPEILSLQTGGSSVNLTVTNHTTTLFAGRNISLKLPASWSDVRVMLAMMVCVRRPIF